MPEAITFVGFVLAAAMTGIAFICWRKAMSFHVLLVESGGRIESIKRKGRQLEAELNKHHEKLATTRSNSSKLEKEIQSEQQRLRAENDKLIHRDEELQEKCHQLDLKNDHLRAQVETMTQQLHEADHNIRDMQTKLSYASKESDEQVQATKRQLEEELKDWCNKHKLLEADSKTYRNQFAALKKKVEESDINRINDIKRKAAHYENLYKSMRGLREMADERNHNWEAALRKLSTWILRTSPTKTDPQSAPLGPMIGEALEIIGERLVYDEYAGAKQNSPNKAATPAN